MTVAVVRVVTVVLVLVVVFLYVALWPKRKSGPQSLERLFYSLPLAHLVTLSTSTFRPVMISVTVCAAMAVSAGRRAKPRV